MTITIFTSLKQNSTHLTQKPRRECVGWAAATGRHCDIVVASMVVADRRKRGGGEGVVGELHMGERERESMHHGRE